MIWWDAASTHKAKKLAATIKGMEKLDAGRARSVAVNGYASLSNRSSKKLNLCQKKHDRAVRQFIELFEGLVLEVVRRQSEVRDLPPQSIAPQDRTPKHFAIAAAEVGGDHSRFLAGRRVHVLLEEVGVSRIGPIDEVERIAMNRVNIAMASQTGRVKAHRPS